MAQNPVRAASKLPTTLNVYDGGSDAWVPVELKTPLNADLDLGGNKLLGIGNGELLPVPGAGAASRLLVADAAGTAAWGAVAATALTDGTELVRRNGTVAMTGDLRMGGQRVTGLADPAADSDAVTVKRLMEEVARLTASVTALSTGIAHEAPVVSISDDPPTIPVEYAYYLVGDNPTGAWAGKGDNIAYYRNGAWVFHVPVLNETRMVEVDDTVRTYNGTSWVVTGQKTQASGSSVAMVGDIKYSMLTEAQFLTELGAEQLKWRHANGQAVPGTKYARITGRNTLPDLRGAYLRMGGQNTNQSWSGGALFGWQEDTTRMPRNTPFTTDASGNHQHVLNVVRRNAYSGHGFVAAPGNLDEGITANGSTNRSGIQYDQGAGNHSHTVTGGGDAETRPKTFAVNLFICVD